MSKKNCKGFSPPKAFWIQDSLVNFCPGELLTFRWNNEVVGAISKNPYL